MTDVDITQNFVIISLLILNMFSLCGPCRQYTKTVSVVYFSILLVYVICCHLQIYLHLLKKPSTAGKSFRIRSFFWSVFSHIRTEILHAVECGKIRTRKNSVFGHFSRGARMKSSYSVS